MTKVNSLPATNIINVTIETTPSGLPVKNVNSVVLLTQDQPINGENYGIYISPSEATGNYGTDTTTSQMVNNVFAQVPNILTGKGRLVIAPMLNAVSATSGNFQSANISANLANIIAVTDGSMNVVLDGTAVALTHLNFTGDVTWADVAATIGANLQDGVVSALTNGIEIASKKVGTASTVTLTVNAEGVDLTGINYLHSATGTSAPGVNSTGETIAAAVARVIQLAGFVGVMSTIDLEDTATEAAAAALAGGDYMFFDSRAQTKDIAGIATTVQQAGQTRTRILTYCRGNLMDAKLYKASYVGRAFSVDFTGSLTSQTLNLKQLVNVLPDNAISQTFYDAANTAGTDLYVSYDGVPSVFSTGGNDFFDNPYSDLALKFALITAGFNYLRQTNTKVPQTEPGMTGLKNAYRRVMIQFVTNGCLAPGSWTSSETFGDQLTFLNNVLTTGFYIYSQPIIQQDPAERELRTAPLVQIAGKRAGAIHKDNVIVIIND